MSNQQPAERIIGVAFRYERSGLVVMLPAPMRHHVLIRELAEMGVERTTPADCTQGFLTASGRFVGRLEAGRIADATGQAKRTVGSRKGGILFSEDLW